jgi:hypothetical protein
MKTLFKKILILCSSISLILSSISANKSNWSGMDLSQDEITNSINFQTARGGNCVGEFTKVQPILNAFINKKIDAAYLENILGKPNEVIKDKTSIEYRYNLSDQPKGCTLRIISSNTEIISYQLESCNESIPMLNN